MQGPFWSVSLTQRHVKGMSVKLKWGLESDRLIGNGPLLASFLQLCKWKSKLEMSSPLVPKLFRHCCRLEAQHSVAAAKLCTLATEQQIYGLGWSLVSQCCTTFYQPHFYTQVFMSYHPIKNHFNFLPI